MELVNMELLLSQYYGGYEMRMKLLSTAIVIIGMLTPAYAQDKAEVIHWWTSGGESKAISVFANAFNAQGGEWVDRAVAGGEAARLAAVNAITGGQPPVAAQFNTSQQFRELAEGGLLANLDSVAAEQNWDQVLPEAFRNVIKIDGHYYAAPVNIHSHNWLWYSKAAFEKAGIEEEPKTKEELFAALDKLKSAGIIGLAQGGQPWQERLTFTASMLFFGGKDLYLRFFGSDPAAPESPEFKQILADYKRLKDYIDSGSPNRGWNEATAMVIQGTAGFQIMGDWAKGEFSAAGQTPGTEFGCIPGFGSSSPYDVTGDVFIFPKLNDDARSATQLKLAALMLSPTVAIEFNKLKGSLPSRLDVDTSSLDACAQLGAKILADPVRQVPAPDQLLSPDVDGALQDVISNFWNTDQSVDDAAAAIAAVLKR